MSNFVVIVLYSGALAIVVSRACQTWILWHKGREALSGWAAVTRLARRYFVDVHHLVAREPLSARMHVYTAGGFLALLFVTAMNALLAIAGVTRSITLPLAGLSLLLILALAYGIWLQARRRAGHPSRLSSGRYDTLRYLFATTCLFFAAASMASQASAPGLDQALVAILAVTGIFGLWRLANMVGTGPMRHAFAGAVHLVSHPRPQRFEGRSTDLKPLALEAPQLGVNLPADFAWNRLAAFDACVQCGRCEQVCPAFAAGLPLNPKKLIADLSASIRPVESRPAYRGSPHPRMDAGYTSTAAWQDLVGEEGAAIHPDTLWACTTCRACVEECPMLIEHVDAIVDMRRHQTLERGAVPAKVDEALANLRMTDTTAGADTSTILDFATDLKLPVLSDVGGTDMLLWLSDGAYDRRSQKILRSFIRLLRKAGVDFAVLGAQEKDSGDLARRVGDEVTFQALARANIETLARYDFAQIVTTDPHALHCLRNEYPAFGGRYVVRHHTDVLNELIAAGRLPIAHKAEGSATYHDPCYLGRYNGEYEAPRAILEAIGFDLVEMETSRSRSRCCGGGGGGSLSAIPSERRIPDIRVDQARRTGAGILAVACAGCTQMLEGVPGDRPDVRDIAELVLQAVEGGR
ncbi:DUF3483 domain-containing protein [Mesorhizobium sp.]|jgi:Fe-S oxidoreductase|uniref:DUF3483 domain-containing protein n=1 Tax=Mesorhizobium sp. TaxID=1871066 RepID=UPI003563B40D